MIYCLSGFHTQDIHEDFKNPPAAFNVIDASMSRYSAEQEVCSDTGNVDTAAVQLSLFGSQLAQLIALDVSER